MKSSDITSESNSMIKHIKSLSIKKYREKNRQYVIEGIRMIDEALRHNIDLVYVLYSESLFETNGGEALLLQMPKEHILFKVSDKLLRKLTDTENPQGIIAVAKMAEASLSDVLDKKAPFLLVLDRLQDPGNMGTTIRTAEAAGVDAVIVTKGSVDPYNSKTLRAAMGAIYHMPIIQVDSDDEWLGLIKERGIKILAGGFEESQDYRSVAYDGSIAIIIGNEANGVDSTLLKAADIIVKIPILGKIESLNASVAAGIIIYKAVEARYFLKA